MRLLLASTLLAGASAAMHASPYALRPARALQAQRVTVAQQEPSKKPRPRIDIRWASKETWAPLLVVQALLLTALLGWMVALAPEQMRDDAAQRRTACAEVRLFTSSVCVPIQPLRLRGGMTLSRGRDPHDVLGVARGAPLAAVRAAYRKQARALLRTMIDDPKNPCDATMEPEEVRGKR